MHEVEINLNSPDVLKKIFIILFIIIAVPAVLGGTLYYFLHDKLGIGQSAVEKAEKIIQFDIPDGKEGVLYVNTGSTQIAAVKTAGSFPYEQILIISSSSDSREEMEKKIQEYSDNQEKWKDDENEKHFVIEKNICGQKTKIEVAQGISEPMSGTSTSRYTHQISHVTNLKLRLIQKNKLVYIQISGKDFDSPEKAEEKAHYVLNSLKCI